MESHTEPHRLRQVTLPIPNPGVTRDGSRETVVGRLLPLLVEGIEHLRVLENTAIAHATSFGRTTAVRRARSHKRSPNDHLHKNPIFHFTAHGSNRDKKKI